MLLPLPFSGEPQHQRPALTQEEAKSKSFSSRKSVVVAGPMRHALMLLRTQVASSGMSRRVERIGDANGRTKTPTTVSCGMYPLVEEAPASRVVLCSKDSRDRRRRVCV